MVGKLADELVDWKAGRWVEPMVNQMAVLMVVMMAALMDILLVASMVARSVD